MRLISVAILLILWIVTAQAQSDVTLVPEEPQPVSVTSEQPALLSFDGLAGTSVTVTATALTEGFDAVLWLVAPDDRWLAYGTQTPHIDEFPLPVDGEYRVYVDSFNGVTDGDVQVNLAVRQRSPIIDNLSDPQEDSTQRFVIQLDANVPHRYQWTTQTGNVTITVRDLSGSLDPVLLVYDDAGTLLARNDDHSSYDLLLNLFDSRLTLSPDEDTPLTIEIRDFLGRGGLVELSIVKDL